MFDVVVESGLTGELDVPDSSDELDESDSSDELDESDSSEQSESESSPIINCPILSVSWLPQSHDFSTYHIEHLKKNINVNKFKNNTRVSE